MIRERLQSIHIFFQDQLSAVEEESNTIGGSEVEALKQTVADKDREIAELSGDLQALQTDLQIVGKYRSEEEEEEEVYRLMVETSELRAKLVEAEGEKWERGETTCGCPPEHGAPSTADSRTQGEKECCISGILLWEIVL